MRWILCLSVTVLVACETQPAEKTTVESGPVAVTAEKVDGFPLPVPAGSLLRAVRNATSEEKPLAGADADIEVRTTTGVEAVVEFYTKLLEARGFSVERNDHERPLNQEPDAPLVRLVRVVATKDATRVFVIITRGAGSHKLQVAVSGPL